MFLAETGTRDGRFEKVGGKGKKEFWGKCRKRKKRYKGNFVDWGLIMWGKDGKIVLLWIFYGE